MLISVRIFPHSKNKQTNKKICQPAVLACHRESVKGSQMGPGPRFARPCSVLHAPSSRPCVCVPDHISADAAALSPFIQLVKGAAAQAVKRLIDHRRTNSVSS